MRIYCQQTHTTRYKGSSSGRNMIPYKNLNLQKEIKQIQLKFNYFSLYFIALKDTYLKKNSSNILFVIAYAKLKYMRKSLSRVRLL